MNQTREALAGSGVHTLRFERGYLQAHGVGQDDRRHLHGPLDYPDAHRHTRDFGLDSSAAEAIQRLVATWDAAVSGDDARLAEFVVIKPHGQVVVWPEVAPRSFHTASDDPDGLRFIFARQAVCQAVEELLQRECRLGFSSDGGFELVPSSVTGLVGMALAMEIAATDPRDLLCAECGNPLRDRQRLSKTYCSDRCKNRARYRRDRAAAGRPAETASGFMVGHGQVTWRAKAERSDASA